MSRGALSCGRYNPELVFGIPAGPENLTDGYEEHNNSATSDNSVRRHVQADTILFEVDLRGKASARRVCHRALLGCAPTRGSSFDLPLPA